MPNTTAVAAKRRPHRQDTHNVLRIFLDSLTLFKYDLPKQVRMLREKAGFIVAEYKADTNKLHRQLLADQLQEINEIYASVVKGFPFSYGSYYRKGV